MREGKRYRQEKDARRRRAHPAARTRSPVWLQGQDGRGVFLGELIEAVRIQEAERHEREASDRSSEVRLAELLDVIVTLGVAIERCDVGDSPLVVR